MIQELTDSEFHQVVDKSPKPYLVAFWAIWSASCLTMTKVLDILDKKYSTKIKIGKVNVDNELKTANEYNVQNIPTVIVFNAGEERDRIPGNVTVEYLAKRIKKYLVKK